MKAPYKIGEKIEVFNEKDEVIEIIVKKIKDISEEKDWSSYVIVSEEGDIYTQDDVNERYVLTPKSILYCTLKDNNIDVTFDELDMTYNTFVELMKNHEYLKEDEHDE